ncbi:hypothetical protein QTP86_007452 [Hemibagrus guttatus]|nr:hypothetical protein QTP86_007452 [Hemibagrus guttatus]
MFYRGTIESVLSSCITAWFGNCTVSDRKNLQRIVRTAEKIIGVSLSSITDMYTTRCIHKANSIVDNPTHPSHTLFTLQPSGKRYPTCKQVALQFQNVKRHKGIMIPVNEFRNIASEQNPRFRVLKPWWDVFSEYLCIAMLMIGVFGCTMQLTQEKISCLPDRIAGDSDESMDCSYLQNPRENESLWEHAITKNIAPNIVEVFGRKNNLDIHQYIFINSFCYERAVHWYGKYFPYLVVIHTMIFMVASSFWFKFPGTSSKIELFVSILGKCFDSPWTTRAISEVSEEREDMVTWKKNYTAKASAVESPDEEDKSAAFIRSTSIVSDREKNVLEPEHATSVLDKKEGEQAKALFEKIVVTCRVPPDLTGFSLFCCNNNKAHLFSKLAYCYIGFVGIDDIPDVKNDFAFLLHLSDQYDPLYSKRFAVFLSEVNNVIIPGTVTQLAALQEISLIHCPARLQLEALTYLRENLKVLRITFGNLEQVPLWMYTLTNLEELHLSGPLTSDLHRGATLDTLRMLKNLRVLTLRGKLVKIPSSVVDVGSQLLRLCVHNEGSRLHAFSSLKKLANLATLELIGCELERLPSAIFSLTNLQQLDLKENRLTTVEEILSLQHCRRLSTLRLWHNSIHYIPEHINKLRSLETLDLSWNKIHKLSLHLCYCTKLRHLDLSHNQLTSLPPEIGILQSLWHLSVAYNSMEVLPEELFTCKRLRTLELGNNRIAFLSQRIGNLAHLVFLELKGNRLETLPVELGDCNLLKLSGIIIEDSLIDMLPSYVKDKMKESV